MDEYTLGLFANLYPSSDTDPHGIFIKRMVDSLKKRNIKVNLAVKASKSVLAYPKFYLDSLSLQRMKECDIFQAHYIPHSSLVPAFLKNKKQPLVLKFHGDDGRIYPFKNRLYREITRYMIRKSDHLITVSNELKENLISLGTDPEKISVLGSGISTDKFVPLDKAKSRIKLSLPTDANIFLFIGRLHPWKGITEIIETAKLHPNSLFYFIGFGEVPSHPENCFFIGTIPHDQIVFWISAADCLLLPSYTEGLPNVLMEALSSERPVIASNVGGCPEIVQNYKTGILIPPKDVNELSKAVQWMLDNEDERTKMGISGRKEMIIHYEHETLIDKLVAIHNTLIEEYNER